MYPFGWNLGEAPRPRDTFKEFQEFSDEAREFAAIKAQGKDYDTVMLELLKRSEAANDNPDNVGDQAILIMLSKQFMNMLHCWLLCDRDMLLTKLTYLDNEVYLAPQITGI